MLTLFVHRPFQTLKKLKSSTVGGQFTINYYNKLPDFAFVETHLSSAVRSFNLFIHQLERVKLNSNERRRESAFQADRILIE